MKYISISLGYPLERNKLIGLYRMRRDSSSLENTEIPAVLIFTSRRLLIVAKDVYTIFVEHISLSIIPHVILTPRWIFLPTRTRFFTRVVLLMHFWYRCSCSCFRMEHSRLFSQTAQHSRIPNPRTDVADKIETASWIIIGH